MEYWKIGMMDKAEDILNFSNNSIFPIFHYSNIPVFSIRCCGSAAIALKGDSYESQGRNPVRSGKEIRPPRS
jgi:hypothetical protein